MQQTHGFQQLDQSQQDLIQTLTGALKDGRGQYEAIVERHAVAMEDGIKEQHERTRALNSEEAESTRRLITANHEESLEHEAEQHVGTRDVVIRERARAAIVTAESRNQIIRHVDLQTADQTKALSSNFAAAQNKMQQQVCATSIDASQDIRDTIDAQHFVTSVEVSTAGFQTVNMMSEQLRQAQLQIQELAIHIRTESTARATQYGPQSIRWASQPTQRQKYPPVNPADQNPPCNTLYVGNLPFDTSEDELEALFSKQRGYKQLCLPTEENSSMCLVEFEDISFATKALHKLYGVHLHNSVMGGIQLSFSKTPLGGRAAQPWSNNPSIPLSASGQTVRGLLKAASSPVNQKRESQERLKDIDEMFRKSMRRRS